MIWEVNLRGVTSQEVVAGLFRGELADGRKHTESITGQHDDVSGLLVNNARDLSVGNVFDRVSATSILSDADVIVIWNARHGVIDDVLEDATVANGVVDIRFLLCGEVNALGVASTFDVEDTSVGPDVLIVTNEETVRIG